MVKSKKIMSLALTSLFMVRSLNIEHIVKMKNFDNESKKNMVFNPIITIINPGDTIRFVPDPSGHYSQSLDYAIPEDTKGWKTEWNKDESIKLEKPGFYAYICPPHLSLGMVGLIIVKGEGMFDNYEKAKKGTIDEAINNKEKKEWENIWKVVEKMIDEGKLNKKNN